MGVVFPPPQPPLQGGGAMGLRGRGAVMRIFFYSPLPPWGKGGQGGLGGLYFKQVVCPGGSSCFPTPPPPSQREGG